MKISNVLVAVVLCGLLMGLVGCTDLTGRGAAPLDRTVGETALEHPRVGHVYCLRGWLGIFSTGMDALADQIDKDVGASAVSVADEEWRRLQGFLIDAKQKGEITEPLVFVGHSYGADDVIRVSEELQKHGISVDLMVLIDPVTPPKVPTNVKRVYCVYKSHPVTDWYPAWRGVAASVMDEGKTPIVNIDLRTTDVGFDTSGITHPNIEKSEGVHKMVMEQVEMACPLRAEWAREHAGVQAGTGVSSR